MTRTESAELREANWRVRLLEQENEAAAYLSQAHLPGKALPAREICHACWPNVSVYANVSVIDVQLGKGSAMSQVIAVCNQKGGVGKSTTVLQLARAAVRSGLRVLVIDLDPQGNLTTVAGGGEGVSEEQVGMADALSARSGESLESVLVPGVWEGLTLAPTTGEALGMVRDELILAGAGRETRLREAIDPLRSRFDLILIDCAPSLDQLTINALVAADAALVVTLARLWSANGMAHLLQTIANVRSYYNPNLAITGIVVNMHEARTSRAQHWLSEIAQGAEGMGLRVLEPPVPKSVAIPDATEDGQGVDERAASRQFAWVYEDLLKQIVRSAA